MLGVLFAVVLLCCSVLYFQAKRKFGEWGQALSPEDYPLCQNFLLMGHYLLQLLRYPFQTGYDWKLYHCLAELYGLPTARHNLQVYGANKVGYLLLGILILSFLGVLSGEVTGGMIIFALVVLAAIFFAPDYELKKKIARRKLLICLDFPEFLNKLTLLLNAGMILTNAWERIVLHQQKKTPFYEEVARVLQDWQQGKSEVQALEDFARRCRVPEITRFTAVVLQNLKKGNAQLVPVLRLQADECWAMRKNAAKSMGEEASTKLLLPMMLMFVAILLLVATPAVLALRGL